jgi:hypothetical protein
MDQDVHLAPISTDDREAIVALLNYYVEHDFFPFPDRPVPGGVFDKFLEPVGTGSPRSWPRSVRSTTRAAPSAAATASPRSAASAKSARK